jgi:hypothetical protein
MRMSASWFGSWTHRIQGRGAIESGATWAGGALATAVKTSTRVNDVIALADRCQVGGL